MNIDRELLLKELRFKTSRSGGAGGQHVNKVETKVTLIWDFQNTQVLDNDEKLRIAAKLGNRLNKEGLLLLEASSERSQLKNKELAIRRFFDLLLQATRQKKNRIATKVPKSQVLDRLDRKKKQAQKKQWRGKPDPFQ